MKRTCIAALGLVLVTAGGCSYADHEAGSMPFLTSKRVNPELRVAAEAASAPADSYAQAERASVAPASAARKTSPTAGTPVVAGVERKIVYTASMGLRVANPRSSVAVVEQLVERHGGFIQSSTLDSIVFRVKPNAFRQALDEIEAMGEITERHIASDDVTAQFVDIQLRLETAESSRQRLIALLEKMQDTKAVLEVERDIRRLTEEIESMKGQMRVLSDQVDWATIRVSLQGIMADQATAPRRTKETPFPWIATLGPGFVQAGRYEAGGESTIGADVLGTKFSIGDNDEGLPDGFVPLRQTRTEIVAATAEGYRLRARILDVGQEATLDFWTKALRTELESNRGYLVPPTEEPAMKQSNLAARLLRTETIYEGETWTCLFWLVADPGDAEDVLVIEYVCPKSAVGDATAALEKAVQGLEW